MKASYDPSVRALYLRLERAPVATSVEVGDDIVVDLDENRAAIGVEVLYPPLSFIELTELASSFDFEDRLAEAWSEIARVQPAPTIRTGSAFAFTAIYYGSGPLVAGASSGSTAVDEAHDFALAG